MQKHVPLADTLRLLEPLKIQEKQRSDWKTGPGIKITKPPSTEENPC